MTGIPYKKTILLIAVLVATSGLSSFAAEDTTFTLTRETQTDFNTTEDSKTDAIDLASGSWNCGSTSPVNDAYACEVITLVTEVSIHTGDLSALADKWEDLKIYGSDKSEIRLESYDDELGSSVLAACLDVALQAQGSAQAIKIKVTWNEIPSITSYHNPDKRKLHARFAPSIQGALPTGVTCAIGTH